MCILHILAYAEARKMKFMTVMIMKNLSKALSLETISVEITFKNNIFVKVSIKV